MHLWCSPLQAAIPVITAFFSLTRAATSSSSLKSSALHTSSGICVLGMVPYHHYCRSTPRANARRSQQRVHVWTPFIDDVDQWSYLPFAGSNCMFPSAGDTSHRHFPGTQRSLYTAPTREVFTAHPFEGLHRDVVQCLTSRRSNDALSSARAMPLSFSDAAFCHCFP